MASKLKRRRRQLGLNCTEAAARLGVTRWTLGLWEQGRQKPALALQIVFGLAPREMFPGFFEAVEEGVMQRGKQLYESLDGKTDKRSQAKRDLLEEMPGRWREDNDEAL